MSVHWSLSSIVLCTHCRNTQHSFHPHYAQLGSDIINFRPLVFYTCSKTAIICRRWFGIKQFVPNIFVFDNSVVTAVFWLNLPT
ncbi:hypothetical protein BKA63DRAFT_512128 [Paraphoma chrysanthemicola]|nr:hypothetical protein BKA63DRAFT_512128 [Paraphoma chrysanthemicola]